MKIFEIFPPVAGSRSGGRNLRFETFMRQCAICDKKYTLVTKRVKLRGKYNPTCKRRKYPNLQWTHLESGERVKACTKCIKALAKEK